MLACLSGEFSNNLAGYFHSSAASVYLLQGIDRDSSYRSGVGPQQDMVTSRHGSHEQCHRLMNP